MPTRCLFVALGVLIAGVLSVPDVGSANTTAALNLEWSAPTVGEPDALLADRSGVIVVADRGDVTAVDPSGVEQWSVDVAIDGESTYSVTPSLGGGVVAVPVDQKHVVALDRETGDALWDRPAPGVTATASGAAPDGSGIVAIVDEAGVIEMLDATTGNAIWSHTLAPVDPANGPPNLWLRAGRLVVQWLTDGDLVRFTVLGIADGAVAWDRTLVGTSTIAGVTERAISFAELYEVHGKRFSVAVRSLEVATGQEQWSHELTSRGGYFPTFAGAAVRGTVTIVDLLGKIHAFDAATGNLRWQHATRRKQYEAELHIAGDVVAMSTYGTGLVALSTIDGAPVDTQPIGRVQLGVTIEGAAAAGARLYLLVTRNGEQRDEGEVWSFRATR